MEVGENRKESKPVTFLKKKFLCRQSYRFIVGELISTVDSLTLCSYESKGKQFAKDAPTYPVGLSPEMIAAIQKTNSEEKKSTKKKKPASVTIIKTTDDLRRLNLTNDDNKNASTSTKVSFVDTPPPVDPRLKKLKNLRKKLNDIDVLQKRIDDGELKQPEKNQLDKIHKRSEIMDEIEQLEREIGSSSNDS